jgi:hypothetical protein
VKRSKPYIDGPEVEDEPTTISNMQFFQRIMIQEVIVESGQTTRYVVTKMPSGFVVFNYETKQEVTGDEKERLLKTAADFPGKQSIDYKLLVQCLTDPDVTKRQYDFALSTISKRVTEIWKYICHKSDRRMDWWDYANSHDEDDRHNDKDGFFDPKEYSEFIGITGGNSQFITEVGNEEFYTNKHYKYEEGFPTELLWTDNFRQVVDQHVADAVRLFTEERVAKLAKNKEKKIRKAANEKLRKETLEAIYVKIRAALTEDEYKFFLQNHSR